jgi:A/G-specific adenine glycosylase
MNGTDLTTENPLAALPRPLLAWYRENARDLPWRRTADPYRVWVSEIMLQQTRVAAVLGYYARFLAAFPTAEDLAAAPEDRLLKLWEGLGYYSRARNLQRSAQLLVRERGGRFPDTVAELETLPGVGTYTACAVASACFARREAAVDGNVLRVYARLTDCTDDMAAPAAKKAVRAALQAVMPREAADIRVFNQALMDLGATVCVPGGVPRCGACPLAGLCLGRQRGTAAALPVKAAKGPRRREERTVFVLLRGGCAALRRRARTGLLAGLWEFPNVPGTLDESAAAAQLAAWGLTVREWRRRRRARHIFTHVEWEMTGYVLEVTGDGPAEFLWADPEVRAGCAVPSAFAAFLAELDGPAG